MGLGENPSHPHTWSMPSYGLASSVRFAHILTRSFSGLKTALQAAAASGVALDPTPTLKTPPASI